MTSHPCGCTTGVDRESGIIRSLAKCAHHLAMIRKPESLDQRYYEEVWEFSNGIPQCRKQIKQLNDALGRLPYAPQDGTTNQDVALEIGCGCSMYAPLLLSQGWDYMGVEPSAWAAEWTRSTHCVEVQQLEISTEEGWPAFDDVGLILMAHVLEHMEDAPATLLACRRTFSSWGHLVIVVPDDQDLCNPDHLWFFTEETLEASLKRANFKVLRMARHRHIERESFIYCLAQAV